MERRDVLPRLILLGFIRRSEANECAMMTTRVGWAADLAGIRTPNRTSYGGLLGLRFGNVNFVSFTPSRGLSRVEIRFIKTLGSAILSRRKSLLFWHHFALHFAKEFDSITMIRLPRNPFRSNRSDSSLSQSAGASLSDSNPIPIRTLLVSDVHLGCKHSQSREFLTFLRGFRPETVYLVGDFIDSWKINSGWHWSEDCDQIVQHLVDLARAGTDVRYVPGNHDSFLRAPTFRSMIPSGFPEIEIANEFVFETQNGWRLLVTHGDLFDVFERRIQWISKGGSLVYDACLSLNRLVHRLILNEQRNPYGACAVIKKRVKKGVKFLSKFEDKLTAHARSKNCDGVICGHIHAPAIIHVSDSMLYFNTGDWVENCTALVEHHDGTIELMSRYAPHKRIELPARTSISRSDSSDDIPVPSGMSG